MLLLAKKVEQMEKDFREYVKKIENYNEALGLIYWDLRTGAPKKGVEQRSEVIGTLSTEVFNMSTSQEMKGYINELSTVCDQLSEITKKTLDECRKDYDRNSKIPVEEYKEYVILSSKSESVWEEAKEKSDFKMFEPYLEKMVETNIRFIDYWSYEGNKYNTLLDDYEPGMTVEILDEVFGNLRE